MALTDNLMHRLKQLPLVLLIVAFVAAVFVLTGKHGWLAFVVFLAAMYLLLYLAKRHKQAS